MQEPPVIKQPTLSVDIWRRSAVLYLMSFCAMCAIAALALALVFMGRPHADNTSIIATILGSIAASMPALMALIKGAENAQSIQEVHISINGRMDELLRQASIVGKETGRQAQRDETAAAVVASELLKAPPTIPLTPGVGG